VSRLSSAICRAALIAVLPESGNGAVGYRTCKYAHVNEERLAL